MRVIAFVLVSSVIALLLGWWRSFEGFCSLSVLAVFAGAWTAVRRLRPASPEEADGYEPESPRAREFVLGCLLGLAWVAVTAGAIRGIAGTRIHGWFIDGPGEALAAELEMLARHGAWSSVLDRFDRPLPAHISTAARTRIEKLHYTALTHAAAAIADPAARCAAQRDAATFADAKGIDALERLPFTCAPSDSTLRPRSGPGAASACSSGFPVPCATRAPQTR